MKKKILLMSLFMFLLFSITIAYAARTYSVDINNVDKKIAIDSMANELIGAGFNIITVNDYQLIVRKDVDDIMLRALYGSRYNTTPEVRMALNFAQLENVVRVSAETRIVTNPNSAFEKSQVFDSNATQQMLERFKNSLEQRYAKKPEPIKAIEPTYGFKYADGLIRGTVFVSVIIPGSSAEKEGLQFGDRIVKVNDITITSIEAFTEMLKGPEGSRIQVTLKTDSGEEKTLNLEKQIVAEPGK